MLTRHRLFLIEGLITLAVGVSAIFLMPSSAVATKTWFRPNGWFTDREVGIVVNRVLRDDPTKGDMHNREGITPRNLLRSLSDYDMWPVSGVPISFCMVLTHRISDLCPRSSLFHPDGHSTVVPNIVTSTARLQHGTYACGPCPSHPLLTTFCS